MVCEVCLTTDAKEYTIWDEARAPHHFIVCAEHLSCQVCSEPLYVGSEEPDASKPQCTSMLNGRDDWVHKLCVDTCAICKTVVDPDDTDTAPFDDLVDCVELAALWPDEEYVCPDCIVECNVCGLEWAAPESVRIIDTAHMCPDCVDSERRRAERKKNRRALAETIEAAVNVAAPGQCEDANGNIVQYPKRVWREWMGEKIESYLGPGGLYPDSEDDDVDVYNQSVFPAPKGDHLCAAWLAQIPVPKCGDIRRWLTGDPASRTNARSSRP